MSDQPKDTHESAEKEIFQKNLEILKEEGTEKQATQFWEDYKKYRSIKKTKGRSVALQSLSEESLLRRKFKMIFKT